MKYEKRRYFLTGLLVVVPILITVYLFVTLFLFFDNILGRFISRLTEAYFGVRIPGLGLLVFVVLIFVVGFFATNFLGKKILRFFERLWFKFPIVKKVYPAAKQITKFLFASGLQGRIQKVVLFQYPSKGIYSLGFVTNETDPGICAKTGSQDQDFLNVLVPSVPNPLTGFLVFVPRQDVIFLDMGIEDAMKLVVSGGVLNPQDFLQQHTSELFED